MVFFLIARINLQYIAACGKRPFAKFKDSCHENRYIYENRTGTKRRKGEDDIWSKMIKFLNYLAGISPQDIPPSIS